MNGRCNGRCAPPKQVDQTLAIDLAKQWLGAINKERVSLLKNKVLGPRDTLPPGVERALSMERRFKFKYRGMKNIKASALEEKDFKNRNIVRDFAKQGIHYNTTNAPTPSSDTVKLLLLRSSHKHGHGIRRHCDNLS
jgi:hypothetical protein